METLNSLRVRILRMLGDPDGVTYTNDLLLDAIGAAFDAILPWVPKTAISTITGDGSAVSFALPSDCYQITAIEIQSTGEIIWPAVLSPGVFRGALLSTTNDWIEYPAGFITFSKIPDTDVVYNLYYQAYWTKPTATTLGTTVLQPPDFSMVGVVLYATAYAILPAAVSIAEVRNWLSRQDLGTPEHNPMQKTADYLLKLFAQEMNRHPKITKATR